MSKRSSERSSKGRNDRFLVLAAYVPLLALRLGWLFFRMQLRRRGAVRRFRRDLKEAGMRRAHRLELARLFRQYGSVRRLVSVVAAHGGIGRSVP